MQRTRTPSSSGGPYASSPPRSPDYDDSSGHHSGSQTARSTPSRHVAVQDPYTHITHPTRPRENRPYTQPHHERIPSVTQQHQRQRSQSQRQLLGEDGGRIPTRPLQETGEIKRGTGIPLQPQQRQQQQQQQQQQPGKQGSVYAADDENPSQFTFYREGTPTPSEHTLDQLSIRGHAQHVQEKKEKRKSRRSVFLASIGFPAVVESPGGAGPRPSGEEHEADLGYADGGSQESDRRRICGMPVGLFWGINIAVILLIIGLGVGLGVGLNKGGGDGETSPATTETAQSPTGSPTPTSTPDRPVLTGEISCPRADNHSYVDPEMDLLFVVYCGIDYSSNIPPGGTVELGARMARDMEECVSICAATRGCGGAGWGFIEGDTGVGGHRCWMKGKLAKEHIARDNWTFAVLDSEESG